MTNRYDEKERRIHCAFSEKCGGCDYAGMKYDNELAVKQKYIEELFGEYVKVDDIVGMYRPIHYRNKVHAVVGLDDSRNVIAGTYEENSHRIVDTSDCMIEDSQCTDIIKDIKELIASFKYQPYDEDPTHSFKKRIFDKGDYACYCYSRSRISIKEQFS